MNILKLEFFMAEFFDGKISPKVFECYLYEVFWVKEKKS